jgi:hypothetical protein
MTTQHDQHVKDADQYHAEQQAFFEEVEHQNWLDRMDAIHGPQDAGLDEAWALNFLERMHEDTATWDRQVWDQEGWL